MTVIIIIVIIIIVVRSIKKASQGNGVIGRVKNKNYRSAAELAKMKATLALHKQALSTLRQGQTEANNKRLYAKSEDERSHYAELVSELQMKIQDMEQTVRQEESQVHEYEDNQDVLPSEFNNNESYDEDDYDDNYNDYDDDYYDANKP